MLESKKPDTINLAFCNLVCNNDRYIVMQKVYSLNATETHQKQNVQQPGVQQPTAQPQPELWFNPRTNRWISKSCRVYREILRDRALVEKGLAPGAKANRHKQIPIASEPEEEDDWQSAAGRRASKLKEFVVEQQQRPLSEHELSIHRRDALFAKYKM